jgi:phi LC3 family holin
MNWKVRFKNKVWLAAFLALIVSFVYQVLGMFDIAPTITQDTVIQAINVMLTLLAGLGVLVDPTTTGITDSRRAMSYTKPNGEK